MDALALYRQGRYAEALALAHRQGEARIAALTLLAMGNAAEAEGLLSSWQPSDEAEQAERLSLLGFAACRRGDTEAYQRLALAAAQAAQTPLTLYHLGLSLPPKDGLLALQEALHQLQAQGALPQEQARLAFALARTLRRLGRWAEALSYASLAVLQDPQPHHRLEELTLLAYVGAEPLAELERALPPLLAHPAPPVRYHALWLSLLLQGMQGQVSPELLQNLWGHHPHPSLLAYDLPLLVLLGKNQPSGQALLARRLRAARAQPPQEPLPQALLLLAEGLYRYPQPEACPLLEESLSVLEAGWAEEALRAVAHLCALDGAPLPEPYRWMAQALRPEARVLFLPTELPSLTPSVPYLETLGKAQLNGFPHLRPRSLELLVLLLAHPEGLAGEALAQGLYPEPNPQALKTELCRLRQAGFQIQSRPYRLLTPLEADFLKLQEALEQNRIQEALALYHGSLLPKSQAPGVEALRARLEEALVRAVLRSGEPGLLYRLAERLRDDLRVWEACLATLPPRDPRYPAAQAWVRRLSARYR
ncbi:hypothetical protein Mlute_01948 [Meiothermus luteus]|jgi:hypothetical protein|uniref:Tetratricopeptide repeat protein n=1 Tax=Meiothermus luteus TaxID=2026184 RepID=A0A399EJG3_9DEIN|nr:hypothetical protein [Meiothermus luteus]RIH84255.1 hypothetical protein Mlute_01938 [Meiothermus luteus]RIH84265.1 hypothetical protein Mlute_01948 [Meiothermus luteus]RMH57207.1 MAG: hypothetical protein D6684_04165 [Deinococcota bacterium]